MACGGVKGNERQGKNLEEGKRERHGSGMTGGTKRKGSGKESSTERQGGPGTGGANRRRRSDSGEQAEVAPGGAVAREPCGPGGCSPEPDLPPPAMPAPSLLHRSLPTTLLPGQDSERQFTPKCQLSPATQPEALMPLQSSQTEMPAHQTPS